MRDIRPNVWFRWTVTLEGDESEIDVDVEARVESEDESWDARAGVGNPADVWVEEIRVLDEKGQDIYTLLTEKSADLLDERAITEFGDGRYDR